MSTAKPQHVLIIGAGVTGLCIAQGLKQSGIPFTIFEAEPEGRFRPRDWAVSIHWAIPALKALLPEHLVERLDEASVDPSLDFTNPDHKALRIYNGLTGDLLKELQENDGYLRLNRRRLQALCAEGIDVTYSHRLESLVEDDSTGTVTARFTNGTTATGTLLLGCDSSHSAVRTHLFPHPEADPSPMGIMHINLNIRYPTAAQAQAVRTPGRTAYSALAPNYFIFISILSVSSDPREAEAWTFQVVVSWPGSDSTLTNNQRVALMKDKASALAEPFRSAIRDVPDDVELGNNSIGIWVSQKYDTRGGRVVLAGDAAHAMSPHRGQGCNVALQDAWDLVRAIRRVGSGEVSQPEAVQEVADDITRRGAEEVVRSREAGFASLDWERLKKGPLFEHGMGQVAENS